MTIKLRVHSNGLATTAKAIAEKLFPNTEVETIQCDENFILVEIEGRNAQAVSGSKVKNLKRRLSSATGLHTDIYVFN